MCSCAGAVVDRASCKQAYMSCCITLLMHRLKCICCTLFDSIRCFYTLLQVRQVRLCPLKSSRLYSKWKLKCQNEGGVVRFTHMMAEISKSSRNTLFDGASLYVWPFSVTEVRFWLWNWLLTTRQKKRGCLSPAPFSQWTADGQQHKRCTILYKVFANSLEIPVSTVPTVIKRFHGHKVDEDWWRCVAKSKRREHCKCLGAVIINKGSTC